MNKKILIPFFEIKILDTTNKVQSFYAEKT